MLCVAALLWAATGSSQSMELPQPSRTVFKCEANGAITYSDEPCPGAQRLDIEPTRGLNSVSGKDQTGKDVRREKDREAFAEAVRPLTGLGVKEFEVTRRRVNLRVAEQSECTALDRNIAKVQLEERSARGETLHAVQRELLALRKRYRELRY